MKVKGKSVFCQRLSRSFEKEKQNARHSTLGVCCKRKLFQTELSMFYVGNKSEEGPASELYSCAFFKY